MPCARYLRITRLAVEGIISWHVGCFRTTSRDIVREREKIPKEMFEEVDLEKNKKVGRSLLRGFLFKIVQILDRAKHYVEISDPCTVRSPLELLRNFYFSAPSAKTIIAALFFVLKLYRCMLRRAGTYITHTTR